MDPTTTLQTVQAWPVEEQLEFLFRAWDQLIDSGWQPEQVSRFDFHGYEETKVDF